MNVSDQVATAGDKLHINTRRQLHEDVRRHFAGEVIAASSELYEVRGFSFIYHSGMNEYRRNPEIRTRIFSLADAGHIVNKLPRGADIASVKYQIVEGRLVVTDTRSFTLDINEFGHSS